MVSCSDHFDFCDDISDQFGKTLRTGQQDQLVMGVENYGRHLNSVIPLIAVVVLRDLNGLKQLAAVTITGFVASHGPKRLLNDVEFLGTRWGSVPNLQAANIICHPAIQHWQVLPPSTPFDNIQGGSALL